MNRVFPNGLKPYTKVEPRRMPGRLKLLQTLVTSTAAPQWSEEQRQAWAAEIDGLRRTLQAALDAHEPIEDVASTADAVYRVAVRTALDLMRSFKRDLQSLGLTKTQIFEIIPDGTPAPKAPRAAPPQPANTNASSKAA